MILSTKGIVLKSIKYSETSIISKIYTRELGLRSYIVNGVRQHKSRFKQVYFSPLSCLELVVYEKENKNLQRIKEVKPFYTFTNWPFSHFKNSFLLFLQEFLIQLIREESSNAEVFDFLSDRLNFIDKNEDSVLLHFPLFFLLEMASLMGIFPQNNYSKKGFQFDLLEGFFKEVIGTNSRNFASVHASAHLHRLLDHFNKGKSIGFDAKASDELFELLLNYFRFQLDHFKDVRSAHLFKSAWLRALE